MVTFLRPIVSVALVLATPAPLSACLWDRDTLRAEMKGMPGVAEVIVGRFERFPPEYYSMRLERVTREIDADSTDLALYDDAGVACDRLGRGDEAINWMAEKKSAMDESAVGAADLDEHRYRYHANLGTFLVHKWLREGAEECRLVEVREARNHIAKAIEIKPDAHFGREKFQLMALEWIVMLKSSDGSMVGDDDDRLSAIIPVREYQWATRVASNESNTDDPWEKAVKGLSGLIALGDAWESVDVFFSLFVALEYGRDSSLATLAANRIFELQAAGERSMTGEILSRDQLSVMLEDMTEADRYFSQARLEAETWHEARTSYMMEQFSRGEHPDTHPDFWTEFQYAESPPEPEGRQIPPIGYVILLAVVCFALLFFIFLVRPVVFLVLAMRARATTSQPEIENSN